MSYGVRYYKTCFKNIIIAIAQISLRMRRLVSKLSKQGGPYEFKKAPRACYEHSERVLMHCFAYALNLLL